MTKLNLSDVRIFVCLTPIRMQVSFEERTREWSADGRREVRVHEAEPVLDRIGTRIAELEKRALPKSALAKAVWYISNQWQALRRYTEDGRLTIDNNVSERTLRHQAIGRKNWMFLGSGPAGPRAAVLFTILAGAKRHRIEPWAYLGELLLRLHNDHAQLDEMLPDRWACQHPESLLTYRLEESRHKAANRKNRRLHRSASRRSQ
jgi:transposase